MGRMQYGSGGAMAAMGYGSGSGQVAGGMGYGGGLAYGGPFAGGTAAASQLRCDGFGMTYALDAGTARMAAGLGDVFSFTVAAGAVVAAAVTLPTGATIGLPLAAGVAYSVSGADVLATRTLPGGISEVRYSDTDGDGLYQAVGTARVLTAAPHVNIFGLTGREALEVTISGGDVTGVTRLLPNGYEWVLLSGTVRPAGIEWTLQDGLVVETATYGNGATTWEVFRDGNGDGRYTEVASGTGQLVDLVGVLAATDAVVAAL